MKTYIHYGSKQFDKERFVPIQNCYPRNKPIGGLWASDVKAEYGWKQWCEDNGFYCERNTEDNCFRFTLAENAKILTLVCADDVKAMPLLGKTGACDYKPNFEEILSLGYDAIDFRLSEEIREFGFDSLYWYLYGWDCDSILILNKDIVIPITEE